MKIIIPTFYIKNMTRDTPELTNTDITPGLEYLGWENSPVITNNYTDNQGMDGSTFNGTTFDKSVINAKFLLHTTGHYDMQLARHDVYKVFGTKDLFRIRSDSSPAKVAFVRVGSFSIAPAKNGSKQALITIPFDNPSGYLYSLANSEVLKEYGQEAWQYGENLPNGKDLQYQFLDRTNFKIYNASDVLVDPYFQRHQLKIIIKHVGGAFGITNQTTGDDYQFKGNMQSNDVLMVDGINSYLNGKIVDNQTNYSYLTLAPGWNEISITGGSTDFDITFSFPFIYLD